MRTVKVSYRASYPDLVEYAIAFANDWADDLAIKTSATVPADAWLPAPVAPTVLANLTGLTVTALNGSDGDNQCRSDAAHGRRVRDPAAGFCLHAGRRSGPGDARDPAHHDFFPGDSANDRFYIRMYDGSTPPNYSEFSTALFINLPLGS